MMGPFSGRRVKAGRTCGRGRACPENNGGSDVYDGCESEMRRCIVSGWLAKERQ